MYIYCITNNISGKKYVGKCHRTPENTASYYGSGKLIKQSIAKDGKENFTKEILERDLSLDNIEEREIFWIKALNTKAPVGYNLCDGGGGLINPSEEVRNKMREAKKGEKAFMYGKHHSEETKRKISENRKFKVAGEDHPNYGKHLSEETKKKISETNKKYVGEKCPSFGRKHTEEAKYNMSKAQKGRKRTPEQIEKHKQKMLGRSISEEHRRRISEGNKGKFVSEESRKRMQEGQKNRMKVRQIDINTGDTLAVYESLSEASRFTKVHAAGIGDCLRGKQKKAGGFKWEKVN